MPLIITDKIQVCFGNRKENPLCGKDAGEMCGGCEEFKAALADRLLARMVKDYGADYDADLIA
jgi:hypothetical protein